MILCFWSCKKKDSTISNAPIIAFISQNPSIVNANKDSIIFTISYSDVDGDLGENNSNVDNLFLVDNRINITYKYRIKQLAPTGSKISIKGNLEVMLNKADITDNSASQTATFGIYLIDRAGNKSNVVTSGVVTVNK